MWSLIKAVYAELMGNCLVIPALKPWKESARITRKNY